MADLLDLLERTPLLESLTMVAAGPLGDDVGSHDNVDKVVHLPHLNQLELVGRSARSGIISHLSLPVSAYVTLSADVVPSRDGVTENFLPSTLKHIPMARNVTAINFSVSTSCTCSIRYIGLNGTIYITAPTQRGSRTKTTTPFHLKPSVPSSPYLQWKSRKCYSTVSRGASAKVMLPKLPTVQPSGRRKISARYTRRLLKSSVHCLSTNNGTEDHLPLASETHDIHFPGGFV